MLKHGKSVGNRVAIIGAGGIGFDVAEFLSHKAHDKPQSVEAFMAEWGVDMEMQSRGGLKGAGREESREYTLCDFPKLHSSPVASRRAWLVLR